VFERNANMKYNKIGKFFFGYADLTITEIGRYCPDFFYGMSMLITCLDSTRPVIKLSRWMQMLDSRKFAAERFDDGILIPASETMRIFREGFTFYGFDEIYLFKDRPLLVKSEKSVFTTAAYNFSENVPLDFIRGFLEIGATRYISDGCGLNFACESEQLLKLIENTKL
jgi:hypothetical protein